MSVKFSKPNINDVGLNLVKKTIKSGYLPMENTFI